MTDGGAANGPTDPWGNPVEPPASPWWGTGANDPETTGAAGPGADDPAPGARSGARGLAISGLVSGVVGFFVCGVVLGPLATVLGVLARRRLRAAGEPGEGLATAAIVLGVIVFVLNIVVLIYVFTNPDALDSVDGAFG
jgi:hypothetical protein